MKQTYMSHDMTKPTKWVCALRRLRSAWHPPSLIKVLAVRTKKAWVLSYPLNAQRRLWSDWADAQAELSLRCAYSHFVGFVMSRLTCSDDPQQKQHSGTVSNDLLWDFNRFYEYPNLAALASVVGSKCGGVCRGAFKKVWCFQKASCVRKTWCFWKAWCVPKALFVQTAKPVL